MTSIRSTLGGTALIAVVVLLGCGACSSNKSSSSSTNTASQQVCDARSDFSSAVSKVGDDLRSFNLGDARSDAETVQSTFSKLMDAVNQLTQQQRQQLQPQIDQIKSDISSFSDVQNSDQLQSNIDTTKSDVQSVIDSVQSDLHC